MTQVIFFATKSLRPDLSLSGLIGDAVRERGWTYKRLGIEERKQKNRLGVISCGRAEELYRTIHLEPTCVLSPVPLALGDAPARYGGLPVGALLRYKAFFRVVAPHEVRPSLDAFLAWRTEQVVEHSDPRVLPLHLFLPGEDTQGLDSHERRQRFKQTHRHQGQYRDSSHRPWQVPPPGQMHGRDVLTVRGLPLQTGYHWDVQTGRNASTLLTLTRKRPIARLGHLNVHPDGKILPEK